MRDEDRRGSPLDSVWMHARPDQVKHVVYRGLVFQVIPIPNAQKPAPGPGE